MGHTRVRHRWLCADGEAMPMSVEKLLHEPKRRLGVSAVFETVEEDDAAEDDELRTGSTLTWFHATPPADRSPEMGRMDLQEGERSARSGGMSPGFVLNRGIITPDHLLPEVFALFSLKYQAPLLSAPAPLALSQLPCLELPSQRWKHKGTRSQGPGGLQPS